MTEALTLSTTREGAVRLEVHASPRARRSGVVGVRGGALAVRLSAAPVAGAANEELLAALGTALAVTRDAVSVVRGEASRHKIIEIRGLDAAEVRARLARAMPRP
jgi:uncharacterized protein (TIGR00251 family)